MPVMPVEFVLLTLRMPQPAHMRLASALRLKFSVYL
jgi:hypothetical protein